MREKEGEGEEGKSARSTRADVRSWEEKNCGGFGPHLSALRDVSLAKTKAGIFGEILVVYFTKTTR